MQIAMTKPLFAWDCIEDSPSLSTVREFLRSLPDEKLTESLENWRGNGRNDYPVKALWGTMLLTILLRHQTTESCLGELQRNEPLRRLIGIESGNGVPKQWNISRFLEVLGREPHLRLLAEVFDEMVTRLGKEVPDLGRSCAGDATGLNARVSKRKKDKKSKLPEPSGGKKEYKDENGKVVKVLEWFGYKLHLLVDDKHEVALAYKVSSTKRGDNEEIPALVEEAQRNLPKGRIETMSYDKAADDEDVHKALDVAEIRPVIQNRTMWKDELERMLPGHDGRSNIVYDESGTVYCYDKVSALPVRRKMAYIGYEKSRGTLKYRCPAEHNGWKCPSDGKCNGDNRYGKTVRVKCEIDLRRFPPIPRATKEFERVYKGRTATERVNAGFKIFWGADDGNIVGAERFHAFVGAVMVVHIGLATLLASTPRREGTLGKMRLGPIAKALREKMSS